MKTKLAASPRQLFLCLSKSGALSSGPSTNAKQVHALDQCFAQQRCCCTTSWSVGRCADA